MGQQSFSDSEFSQNKKVTRREQFLKKVDQIIPWEILMKPIRQHYPGTEIDLQTTGLEIILRIYLMQQWYGLSDSAMEDSLYDIVVMRQFARIDQDEIPDEATFLTFRHLLERHSLKETLLCTTDKLLFDRSRADTE